MAIFLPEPRGFSVRPIQPADAPALRDQLREVQRVDDDLTARPARATRLLAEAGAALDANSRVVMGANGAPVGAVLLIPGRRTSACQVWLAPGFVSPAFRGRGIGTYLMEWAIARGRELAAGCPRVTVTLHVDCREGLEARQSLYRRHGFRPVRQFRYLHRDLAQSIARPDLPDGVALAAWSPDLEATVCDAANTAFARHWAGTAMSADRWRAAVTAGPGFRSDLSVVAMKDASLIGYALSTVDPDDEAGRQEAWVTQVGVLPEWRNQGVATALMAAALDRMRAGEFTRALASADAGDEAPGVRLCLKAGYEAGVSYIRFARTLDVGGAG